jgi:hypothetical protein
MPPRLGDERLALARTRPAQELVEQRDAIAARVAEALSVRREGLCDIDRVIEDALEGLAADLGDRIGIDMVGEELANHRARPRRRQATHEDPLLRRNPAAVQADVGPPRLASMWDRELVDVGPQVPDPVQTGGRGVGDDRHSGIIESLPCRPGGIELKPSRTKPEVIRLRRSPYAIDAMRHPLEESPIHETRQRAPGDVGSAGLLQGEETPLLFGDVAETRKRARHAAKYTIRVILCSMA